jgi:hypothetical protein
MGSQLSMRVAEVSVSGGDAMSITVPSGGLTPQSVSASAWSFSNGTDLENRSQPPLETKNKYLLMEGFPKRKRREI